MDIKNYLENYQKNILQTFINAINNKRISHAYLLSGENGMPLKESAIFFAKSLLCEHPNPLACSTCETCRKIDDGSYYDLLLLDGEDSKIKKGDIDKIESQFDKTALNNKGVMVYIINLVENMMPAAVNSLLKFLEEPGENVFAFLTTENESKVLPTILSRTQILHFKIVKKELIINDAINEGVNQEDALILSNFYSNPSQIKLISESNDYVLIKKTISELLEALDEGMQEAMYFTSKNIDPVFKNNKQVKLFLKMLSTIFKDMLSYKLKQPILVKSFENIYTNLVSKLPNIDKNVMLIMSMMTKLDYNVNTSLLFDHLIYSICEAC